MKNTPALWLMLGIVAATSLSACRSGGGTHASTTASPTPSAAPRAVYGFGVPVGMLPVKVVGSYGGGGAAAAKFAGKHPLPSGLGVPIAGSSGKESSWACMVLLYGNGAAVQYEGFGRCGTGKQEAAVKSSPCQVTHPNGKIVTGWCVPRTTPAPLYHGDK